MPFQFRKEAIEEDLNTNFPSQGQGNPPLYYSLSEVVVPTYSINDVAQGGGLPENLQTAWDFSTGTQITTNTTNTLINNAGFWRVQSTITADLEISGGPAALLRINNGVSTKIVWALDTLSGSGFQLNSQTFEFVVFLRSGDSLEAETNNTSLILSNQWRQIADLNGNLINPLGFSFA